ncbi:MAG: hypothetical protein H6867_04530 [Rhodospirillales bacterium]|nr:hypothetical protein [Rhodospirillales bacterium]MCB9996417.1 hypothetical protein [Rhodospirillales bacterium]
MDKEVIKDGLSAVFADVVRMPWRLGKRAYDIAIKDDPDDQVFGYVMAGAMQVPGLYVGANFAAVTGSVVFGALAGIASYFSTTAGLGAVVSMGNEKNAVRLWPQTRAFALSIRETPKP